MPNLELRVFYAALASLCFALSTLALEPSFKPIRLAQNSAKPPPLKQEPVEFTIGGNFETETVISVPMNPKAHIRRCEADASIFFTQMDDRVRVKTHIDTKDCAKAHGGYTIFMRTENESGEITLNEFSEDWVMNTDSSPKSKKFYPMKGAIELKSVDLKRLTCTCDEEPTP